MENDMSRKHFIAIASAIRTNFNNRTDREAIAKALLPALRETNPNFNADRFLTACVGGSND
jgi:hypothetical protein